MLPPNLSPVTAAALAEPLGSVRTRPHCTESDSEGQRGAGLAQSHLKTQTQYPQTPAGDIPVGEPESLAAPPSAPWPFSRVDKGPGTCLSTWEQVITLIVLSMCPWLLCIIHRILTTTLQGRFYYYPIAQRKKVRLRD